MALTFGKLTFLVGAGILTSVLAKEGRLSSVSDAVGGTLKIVSKLIKQDDPGPSDRKLFNDLLAEVSSVQQELSHVPRSVIIETSSGSGTGAKKYGVIVVIVAVGYGYVWWKGWKLPDMMFATRRSLSDACNSVARQLEDVYSSISAAQRQLSSKITSVDRDVNKIVEISQATQEEVTILRGRSKLIGDEFQSVRDIVQTLESKLIEIEGKQDITTLGVKKLCDRARELENGRPTELVQASRYTLSRTTLELPGIMPSSRSGSLHPLPLEPPSPSDSNGSHKVDRQNSVSASGLKEFNGVTKLGESSRSPKVSNGIAASEDLGSWSSSNGVPGRRFSGSVLTRQRSATNGLVQQVLSSGQQC